MERGWLGSPGRSLIVGQLGCFQLIIIFLYRTILCHKLWLYFQYVLGIEQNYWVKGRGVLKDLQLHFQVAERNLKATLCEPSLILQPGLGKQQGLFEKQTGVAATSPKDCV